MKLLFKEVRAAFGVADVFGGVATGVELHGYRAALKRGFEFLDALAVRMIEALGNAQDGRNPAHDALVGVVQGGVSRMVGVWGGLAIVIANDSGNDSAVAPVEPGNIAVKGEIFAVLVMAAVADAVTDVVEQGPGFELHARLRRQMVQRLQVVEKHQAKLPNVLRVSLIIVKAAGKAPRADEELPGLGIVAMRFLARKGFAGDFLEQSLANTNGGNDELADIEVAGQDRKNNRGDLAIFDRDYW